MIRSEKKISELASVISKGNSSSIVNAINLLRDDVPFEGAISILSVLYSKTNDHLVKKSIEGFMNDIKDQTACIEVINEIRKDINQETTSMLISSCWQSGLNYSEYSEDFAGVFLKGDYVTAIECLTVIEESASELTTEKRSRLVKMIKENSFSPKDEKKTLTTELLNILNR